MRGSTSGRTVACMWDNTNTIKNTVLGHTPGRMDANIRENGRIAKGTVGARSSLWTGQKDRGFGSRTEE